MYVLFYSLLYPNVSISIFLQLAGCLANLVDVSWALRSSYLFRRPDRPAEAKNIMKAVIPSAMSIDSIMLWFSGGFAIGVAL